MIMGLDRSAGGLKSLLLGAGEDTEKGRREVISDGVVLGRIITMGLDRSAGGLKALRLSGEEGGAGWRNGKGRGKEKR